jgi:hypothetical protein
MSYDAAHEEAGLEQEARQRAEEIRATEEVTARATADDTGLSSDVEIAQTYRSGRQHDHTDTAAYRSQVDSRRSPRR